MRYTVGSISEPLTMPSSFLPKGKPRKPYIRADWKISLPAPLAGRLDMALIDPLTQKPRYGARARLIEKLLEHWLAVQHGQPTDNIQIPTLLELREQSNA